MRNREAAWECRPEIVLWGGGGRVAQDKKNFTRQKQNKNKTKKKAHAGTWDTASNTSVGGEGGGGGGGGQKSRCSGKRWSTKTGDRTKVHGFQIACYSSHGCGGWGGGLSAKNGLGADSTTLSLSKGSCGAERKRRGRALCRFSHRAATSGGCFTLVINGVLVVWGKRTEGGCAD